MKMIVSIFSKNQKVMPVKTMTKFHAVNRLMMEEQNRQYLNNPYLSVVSIICILNNLYLVIVLILRLKVCVLDLWSCREQKYISFLA